MSQSEQNRRIAYGICRHFQSQVAAGVLGEDGNAGIEIALQCISQAYGINLESESDREKYEVKTTLEELYATVPLNTGIGGISDEDKKKAETYKQQGNVHLKLDKFNEAVTCYTKAVQCDPNNATYFCNRAAAYIKLDQLDSAVEDCKKALTLNPDYARAHGRLGYIYSSQSKFELSRQCFQKALQLDPNNDSYRSNLQTVDEQLRTPPAAPNAAAGGGAGAGPDPSAANPLAGLLGMVNNPGFINMATTLMQTPAFQNVAGQMLSQGRMPANMSDVPPDMLQGVTQAAREMQQTNPEMFQNFQDQVLRGAGAAQQQQQQPPQGGTGGQQDPGGKGGQPPPGSKGTDC